MQLKKPSESDGPESTLSQSKKIEALVRLLARHAAREFLASSQQEQQQELNTDDRSE